MVDDPFRLRLLLASTGRTTTQKSWRKLQYWRQKCFRQILLKYCSSRTLRPPPWTSLAEGDAPPPELPRRGQNCRGQRFPPRTPGGRHHTYPHARQCMPLFVLTKFCLMTLYFVKFHSIQFLKNAPIFHSQKFFFMIEYMYLRLCKYIPLVINDR